jgi:aminoglycoside phosphotransferase (APT) family kinase protein
MSPQKVREGEGLGKASLKRFLHRQDLITSADVELNIRQFTAGYSNLTYLLQTEDNDYVLRKPPAGAVERGHDMNREFTVQSALQKSFGKVPAMYAFCDDENVLGSDFYIMERVEGIILHYKEAKQKQISPLEYARIADAWLDTMVELHALDYKSAGLEKLGKPEGYVERQVTNWGKQFMKAATGETELAEQVMQWMQEHQPEEYSHCLIHNDYKYNNIVFEDDSWESITAVLDWEMATLGDPLMDLGTSLGYWTVAGDPEMVKRGIPSPTTFDGNPTRREIAQLYAQKSGRNVDHLTFYYVYGLFKIAVIAQQIYYRYEQGLTADPKFKNLDKAAQLCCKIALKAIQTGKIN